MSEEPAWMKQLSAEELPAEIDTSVPHSARVANYWLGGKDNYAADRVAGDMVRNAFPQIVELAVYSRAFLGRAVTYLVGAGIRQFLDIGTGLPTADNTHEIAQRNAPDSKIVYVDNDPLVLAHARALLTSAPEGATRYVDADLTEPDTIISAAGETLDFDQPIAIILSGILGHIEDYELARSIVGRLVDALAPGSHLTVADHTNTSEAIVEASRAYNENTPVPYLPRSPEQIAGYFDGLELVEPGVVQLTHWRADDHAEPPYADGFAGVGRKP